MDERTFARFDAKVRRDADGCWHWTASIGGHGYGQLSVGGRAGAPRLAHRLSYEHFVGAIPDGLVIDHLCRNRSCVNPAHLEAVPQVTNARRGDTGLHNKRKTHCPHGHEYTEENMYRYGSGRWCRTCALGRSAARQRAR